MGNFLDGSTLEVTNWPHQNFVTVPLLYVISRNFSFVTPRNLYFPNVRLGWMDGS